MKTFLRQTFIVMLMAFGALAAVVICLDAAGVSENSLLPGIGFSNSGPAGGFVSLSLVATVCLWLVFAMFLIMLETERFDEVREIGEEMLALPIKVRGSDSIIMLEDVRRKLFL